MFISCCAVIMAYATYTIVIGKPINIHLAFFIFFSTICSYNFHWALTPHSLAPSQRLRWDQNHKNYHLLLSIAGAMGALVYFFYFKDKWFYIVPSALLTFLYSAPKISFFQLLKKVAIGKTIFLAMIWAYVTAALPILIEGSSSEKALLFCIGQFFFIYAICILFDFRDREDDKANGIRSMITYFNERGINILFIISVTIFIILDLILKTQDVEWSKIALLIFPAFILISLYKYAKRNFSDYLYYFVLDGLMMMTGLLLWLMNRF